MHGWNSSWLTCTDCNFVAVLYTSESEKMMRYTDEARLLTRHGAFQVTFYATGRNDGALQMDGGSELAPHVQAERECAAAERVLHR